MKVIVYGNMVIDINPNSADFVCVHFDISFCLSISRKASI